MANGVAALRELQTKGIAYGNEPQEDKTAEPRQRTVGSAPSIRAAPLSPPASVHCFTDSGLLNRCSGIIPSGGQCGSWSGDSSSCGLLLLSNDVVLGKDSGVDKDHLDW